MGLGPNNMQQGDHVAILQDARTPSVLRKVVRSGLLVDFPLYGVVGEAYLDGVMQGELFEDDFDNLSGWQPISLV
jgi:hypothetical protein